MKLKYLASILGLTLLVSCTSIQPGDDKIGNIPLDPAVEQGAKLLDSYVPGSGSKLKDYFAKTKVERVPSGYKVSWNVKKIGQGAELAVGEEMPEDAWKKLYKRVPHLEENTSNNAPVSLADGIKNDVELSDVTSKLTPEQLAELLKVLGNISK